MRSCRARAPQHGFVEAPWLTTPLRAAARAVGHPGYEASDPQDHVVPLGRWSSHLPLSQAGVRRVSLCLTYAASRPSMAAQPFRVARRGWGDGVSESDHHGSSTVHLLATGTAYRLSRLTERACTRRRVRRRSFGAPARLRSASHMRGESACRRRLLTSLERMDVRVVVIDGDGRCSVSALF